MTDALDTLASDFRLHELFGDDQLATATQIWILEIERAASAELRFLYGRSLPGTHESHKWSGTSSSKTSVYDGCSAKTHALALYTSTQQLKIFLKHFLSGATLDAASQLADIQLDEKLNSKVGATLFGGNPVARPVMHLPTRDFFQFRTSRLSPTSYASVDSAAISSDSKAETFNMAEGLDRKIAEAACQSLNADTGLDFASLDAWRIGDFEFICIPGQNRAEKSKYEITLKGDDASLKLSEPLTQDASDLLVVVNAYSADSVLATHTARLDKHEKYPLKHGFRLETFVKQICTSFTLEIYALSGLGESFLVLQTGNYFVRSMNLNMQMVEPIRSNEKLSWLEKRVPPKDQAKLQATARVGRALRDSRSQLGGHTADPWVALNSATETTMKQLCPKTSKGRFFLTLTDSGGTSRIQLTEWLRKIFESHHDAQIAWFDPFMEDVGIDLLHRMGTAAGDYLIITTEKESKEDSKAGADQPNRIQNLLNQCTGWGNGYFGNVRLKVLAVPENKIHDRMILIRSASGRPLAGYQLSNSIQRANDNYPLVATPIPLDVMPHVFEYCDQIIQSTLHGEGKKVPTAKLIFDSTSFTKSEKEDEEQKGLNHRSCFTDAPRAGDVLAWWLDDLEFAGLSGAELMNQLEAKGKVKDGKLNPEMFESIPAKFWTEGMPLEDFHSAWDALGYVLAHCQGGQLYTEEHKPFPQELQSVLLEHLNPARQGALQPRVRKALLDLEHYRSQDLTKLLLSTDDPDAAFRYSPPDTSWSDYYALKLLWSHAPQALVNWLSEVCAQPVKGLRPNVLVIEVFKRISLSLGFDKHPVQIEALLHSETSIVTWVGLHAFKDAINKGAWGVQTLGLIDQVRPASAHRTILCWLINEANYDESDVKHHLIAKLTQSLERPLSDQELQDILQPVRGRLGRLHHFTPWILESLLLPMLEQKTVDTAQVSREWFSELTSQWRGSLKDNNSLHFKLEADGAFTDELATLTRYLAPEDQKAIVAELWKIFNALARTIRQPFSAQVSWQSHIRAHEVNLWLYALARRIDALVDVDASPSLAELLLESEEIIDRLPDSYRDYATSTELLTYMKGDPNQLKFHRLGHTIYKAITSGQ
ncbi:VPA1262 family protein [Pseudomonas syringae]|uniref:VPA1262 family protein n=1 Tax=Pseudomonas syringae TaxID=317 RepID=UPI0005C871E2|nr:VPA1262 family protein [Pseudomonas syringae]PHN51617.1 hypothetical protein AO254_22730 [Pseudomonas syringae]POD55959.1 hypothetical protein BKM15_00755 [Pseudomonas syringae pv. syringae]RMM53617.1 hypothetical protein ALQ76_04203 [Pseudomonas syringae pv. atrofaciens]